MNWYEKIQAKMNEEDESRELKKGDVKKILIATFDELIPEFKYNNYKSGIYYFSRKNEYREFPIYESFEVGFSLKERNFYCSVSSCFDMACQFERSYNLGPLNLRKDLIAIKKNTGVISIEEAYYFHNGKLNRTTSVIQEIVEDYRLYGINFLENRAKLIKENKILNIGLDYIKDLSILATVLIFLLSILIIAPIISNIGYSSVEGSYHAVTHAILLSLICTVIFCTMLVIEKIGSIKERYEDNAKG